MSRPIPEKTAKESPSGPYRPRSLMGKASVSGTDDAGSILAGVIDKHVRDKSVAIIGNSNSIFNGNYGDTIDSHDIIIRINRGHEIESPKSQGSKTDILSISIPIPEKLVTPIMPELVIWATNKIGNMPKYNNIVMVRNSDSAWKKLFDQIGSRPSTGLITINLFANYMNCKNISLFGFDFFKTKTFYHTDRRIKMPHDGKSEEAFVRKLVGRKNLMLY